MANIFLSYTTRDLEYANRVYSSLDLAGFDVWFAPCNISTGNNYAEDIGAELRKLEMEEEHFMDNIKMLAQSKILILLLSGSSMNSKWVAKEVKMAINKDITVIPLRIDNEPLSFEFEYMLSDIQIMEAYHVKKEHIDALISKLDELVERTKTVGPKTADTTRLLTHEEMGVYPIEQGDPYYRAGETLKTKLTKHRFFLAPPDDLEIDEEQKQWIKEHMPNKPEVFGMTWDEIFSHIPIPDLRERIHNSRRKVILQFLHHENGCYFNNLKFGINRINPFERTEDLSERPMLSLEFFTTDYYTHRVMKDVCKQLIAEGNEYLTKELQYTDLTYSRIFFTSLGINLLLLEDEQKESRRILLTSRSANAAETYSKHQYSVSVIEGVSYSDYDSFTENVNLTAAAYRGLLEELGVEEHKLQTDKLRFYDFFVNKTNLEMGISCSVELKKGIDIEKDILNCHGKDERLEIADKKLVELKKLRQFLVTNAVAFLPQAVYTACSYLEAIGDFIIERYNKIVSYKESFIRSKEGMQGICGDAIVDTSDFIAVIDGATPKGKRLWNGMRGDVYITQLISSAIKRMDKEITAESAIEYINNAVKEAYKENGVIYEALENEEKLQASILIYSAKRHEVWSFGDCRLRINCRDYNNIKKLDILMSDLRAFCIESEMLKGNYSYNVKGSDYGRSCIMPFLKEQGIFANTNYSFGYDVINGGDIFPEHVKVYAVQTGDRVIMASDGYPRLFDTLEDSEKYLSKGLKEDPECMYALRNTKGIYSGNVSFDDRAYIGFNVE